MTRYPRSREETSKPPSVAETSIALQQHWGIHALDIRQAASARVYYVNEPDRNVMFRSNPGWDGSIPPPVIVRYIDHLSKQGAPAPAIIPTQTGEPCATWRDHTISVESRLPGEDMSQNPSRCFRNIGKGLAKLHVAARTFTDYPEQMQPVAEFMQPAFDHCLSRPMEHDELEAVEQLRKNIEKDFPDILQHNIPWILCRGDVRAYNTLATANGEIAFTDFDGAEYAPALYDLVMMRFQWLIGVQDRNLEVAEAAEALLGYEEERALSSEERAAFPIIWATYYANRITFLRKRWARSQRARSQTLREKILQLPVNAIEMANEWMGAARGV